MLNKFCLGNLARCMSYEKESTTSLKMYDTIMTPFRGAYISNDTVPCKGIHLMHIYAFIVGFCIGGLYRHDDCV
jgi:hypothetical protein